MVVLLLVNVLRYAHTCCECTVKVMSIPAIAVLPEVCLNQP